MADTTTDDAPPSLNLWTQFPWRMLPVPIELVESMFARGGKAAPTAKPNPVLLENL